MFDLLKIVRNRQPAFLQIPVLHAATLSEHKFDPLEKSYFYFRPLFVPFQISTIEILFYLQPISLKYALSYVDQLRHLPLTVLSTEPELEGSTNNKTSIKSTCKTIPT